MPVSLVASSLRLTHEGALMLVQGAVAASVAMGIAQCIAVVDSGGNLMGFLRMDGANYQAIETSIRKAMTAVGDSRPTGEFPADLGLRLAIATEGKRVNLPGGIPIIVEGVTIGGIGIGSATGEEDRRVAEAAVAAFHQARATIAGT